MADKATNLDPEQTYRMSGRTLGGIIGLALILGAGWLRMEMVASATNKRIDDYAASQDRQMAEVKQDVKDVRSIILKPAWERPTAVNAP